MGAKTWMLAYVDGRAPDILKSNPHLDRSAAAAWATKLFPDEKLEPFGDGNLSYTCPPNNEVHIGCFSGLTVVAAKEFAIDYPSRLPSRFLEAAAGHTVYLLAMHSVVDWFAYAIWVNGTLERSLSLSPENGILENIGPRRAFEEPYWAGRHPVVTDPEETDADYSLPFHPLELGDAALLELFGYQLEGFIDPGQVQPERIPLVRFRRPHAWWKFWYWT